MPALCKRRGKNRWRAQVKQEGKVVGVKWFGTGKKGGKEYKAALLWEEKLRKELQEQKEQQDQTHTVSLTIRDWANAFLDDVKRRRAKSTYTEAKTTFKFLGQTFSPDFLVEDLTTAEAFRHLNTQKDKRSGNAANKDRKNLSRAWNWGTKFLPGFPRDLLNPFLQVERYSVDKKPRYVPPEDDYWKLMSTLEGQDRVMMTAFFHLGGRRSEIFRLKWEDVDFREKRILLSTNKTEGGDTKYTWLPMTEELTSQLLWWWENRKHKHSEYVFTVTGGHRFENQYEGQPFKVRQHFIRKACQRAGIKPFGYHGLRHLCALTLYHEGHSLAQIQAMLCHANARTTETYLKGMGLDINRLREAVDSTFNNRGPGGKVIPFEQKQTPSRVSAGG